ncbi:MAG: flagellar protein FlgN [Thermodesulfobacteriota bacterium]|jgi:flagellar biosynthesis/type III secretory pathway chaperone
MNAQTAIQNEQTEYFPGQPPNGQAFPLPLILDILKRQIAISAGFLAILEEEKHALINMDVASLISLTRKKESELAKIAQLDHSLQEVARRVVTTNPHNDKKMIKLAELIPFMTREQTLAVKQYRDQLAALREKISSNNLINKRFASDTLGYLNDAISLICGEIAGDRLYSMRGRQQRKNSVASLVSREV